MGSQIVWFFDKPTIGYCPRCEVVAIYRDGLVCPKCGTHEVSLFEWDGDSKHPEEAIDG